jgi:NAD(P)-dependent dehydrogenase (short-subunit alcohol dehydrogenase family)
MKTLTGYSALITGGAGGIGKTLSLHLSDAGARVIIWGRDRNKAEETLKEIEKLGGVGRIVIADLQNRSETADAVRKILEDEEQIDILVNNAGISGFMGAVIETPLEEIDNILQTNLIGPFQLSQLLLPGMIKKGFGRIINISSVAPRINPPNSVTYNISKAGLNSLTKSLSREVAAAGITVNAVAPGLVMTDRIKNSRIPGLARETGKDPDEILQGMVSRADTKRLTTESELAQAVLYLCSEGARNITGEVLEMSGGY